ncbi:glycosyltransferase family 25 protein [Rothia aerolata]|uniref:Glycosyl transferase family 25 domain-containing protein n=1 Tax=Rothia aerolata TaxID=1812262 RepID=A0A917ITJ4_9MICC|nr:glycosyltransferase family 25 protein [Rothia aerolata]GGH62948.1 hypothetical protein GCM10007359_13730 [Rothia aerolata]
MKVMRVVKYVIALKSSSRLKKFQQQEFSNGFSIWDAFNGVEEPVPDFVDLKSFEQGLGRPPLPGEFGYSVSHYLLCKNFVETGKIDELMLVAEDDARFSNKAESVISRVVRWTDWSKVGIVVLASPGLAAGERRFRSIPQKAAVMSILSRPVGWNGIYPFILGSFDGMAIGTGCYLISFQAAQKYVDLVEYGDKIAWVADHYNIWAKKAGVEVQLLRPGICSWEGESTIGGLDHDWTGYSENIDSQRKSLIRKIQENLFVRERLWRLKRSLQCVLK